MFNLIDRTCWPRNQVFWYFSEAAPTGYSITVEADISKLLETIKETEYRFFPSYLWAVTKNLMNHTEFCCAIKDGAVGYYDKLTPLYASFHEDNHTFSLMWTEYDPDFRVFHKRYMEDKEMYGKVKGILAKPGVPPENAYTVSAVPWVEFSHFAVHSYENKPYYFPSIEAGKYHEKDGKVLLPISLTCHHATTDGWHIKCFLEELQKDFDNFEMYI